jgi:DNA-binding CsgD family transcriptional regulator
MASAAREERTARTARQSRRQQEELAEVIAFDTREVLEPAKDALDVLARSAAAAFAVDRAGKVVYWNAGAEKMLGWRASEVLGRSCYEVLSGNDPFGNRYCGHNCPIVSVMTAGTEPSPFFMDVKSREAARVKVRVRTAAMPGPGPRFSALVHLLDRGDDQELAHLLDELRASTSGASAVPKLVPVPDTNPLTAREREIVLLLSNGYAALNIAARLDLSHATVRNHIQNILRKLDVHSQVEAIAVSFRRGWI